MIWSLILGLMITKSPFENTVRRAPPLAYPLLTSCAGVRYNNGRCWTELCIYRQLFRASRATLLNAGWILNTRTVAPAHCTEQARVQPSDGSCWHILSRLGRKLYASISENLLYDCNDSEYNAWPYKASSVTGVTMNTYWEVINQYWLSTKKTFKVCFATAYLELLGDIWLSKGYQMPSVSIKYNHMRKWFGQLIFAL